MQREKHRGFQHRYRKGRAREDAMGAERMVCGSSCLLRWSTISETARRSSDREVENEGSISSWETSQRFLLGHLWSVFTNLKIDLKRESL